MKPKEGLMRYALEDLAAAQVPLRAGQVYLHLPLLRQGLPGKQLTICDGCLLRCSLEQGPDQFEHVQFPVREPSHDDK